tara:strand:+ start:2353 stop:3660 length:1308 start_codon:yes stop_codon:yes gene_type:complete
MSLEKSLVVVGAGPMGLAAAYYAAKRGYAVEVVEADDRVGGMAAHFDFDGLSLERFYHFCCLSDHDTLALMEEVGLGGQMKWVHTTMGYQVDGTLHEWGNPFALLKFPKMNIIEKIRYGLQAFISTKRKDWSKLDKLSAEDWFIAWCGHRVYDLMWRPLMEYKFYQYTPKISAAWMWQRIKRLGNSRKSLFEERLGHIEGGTETLMNTLAEKIIELGGKIHLSTPASRFLIEDGEVKGVETRNGKRIHADHVISTAPTPIIPDLLQMAAPSLQEQYKQIDNIGCVCVLLKLKKQVTPHFWVNITGSDYEIPGIVEFSNLRPLPDKVVYVPFYMPNTNEKFSADDDVFLRESIACVMDINPDIKESDVLATHVARLKYAQPIYDVEFLRKLPPIQTPVKGLQIADTCYYYPEDRGVSESIGLARRMVDAIGSGNAQ